MKRSIFSFMVDFINDIFGIVKILFYLVIIFATSPVFIMALFVVAGKNWWAKGMSHVPFP